MPPVNIADLSDEETADLATRCLEVLPLAEKVQAVLKAFHDTSDREELISWLNDAEDDPVPEPDVQ